MLKKVLSLAVLALAIALAAGPSDLPFPENCGAASCN